MAQASGAASSAGENAAGFRPDAVREWLGSLPREPAAASKLLTRFLSSLHASDLGAADRIATLDALRAPVLAALVAHDMVLSNAPQPLQMAHREVLFLARALAEGMAAGYERATAQCAQVPRSQRPPLAPPLLLAMQFSGEVLLASFRSYARAPEGAWKRLHGLHVAAEQHGVATGIADPATRQSVTEAYCEVLLVALTDPYRLAPREMDRVLALLRRLHTPATLTREPPASRPSGHFLVAGDLDQPPRSSLVVDDTTGGPNWRFLDANPVVDRLLEETADGESEALVARLVRLWRDPPQRVYRRDTTSGSVAICVGVKPIAHFVAHDAVADGEAQAAALRERLTMPLHALPQDEAGQLIPIHEWNVVNLSAGGMKVRRTAETAHAIAVGEIVGIKTPGKPSWTVGATRWITALDDGTTEFGVQFFAEAACAVWMKMPSPSTPPRLAILVTFADGDAAEALLAPAGAYEAGLEFELRGEGLRYRARASQPVERNGHFDLFRIEVT